MTKSEQRNVDIQYSRLKAETIRREVFIHNCYKAPVNGSFCIVFFFVCQFDQDQHGENTDITMDNTELMTPK